MTDTANSALAGLFQPELDGAPPPYLRAVRLPGGRPLYEAGDAPDELWFVRAGRLGVTRYDGGVARFLGVVRPGEIVGEMAAVSGTPHAATVTALRDSELWAMPRETFLEIAQHDPQVMMELARLMLARARQGVQPSATGEPRVIGLLGVSPGAPVRALAEKLARAVLALGRRAAVLGPEAQDHTPGWFSQFEADHDLVLLAAEHGESAWREVAGRQSDRLFLVASTRDKPRPEAVLDLEPLRRHELVDLLLVRPETASAPIHGRLWWDLSGAAQLFHLREGDGADLARLARVITGRSVALVLSGGGARAYAHVGAVRALREAGVPIDFLGGASMGAIVAAGVAMGWDDVELSARVRHAFVDTNPLDDIAFPLLAMTHGHKVRDRLAENFGETEIADLDLPFFCVSSDLTAGAPYVHERGLVRDALRASVALPGVLPPVTLDRHVLVDGAVARNFPADLMRERRPGVVLGVDVTRSRGLTPEQVERPAFWPWVLSGGWRKGPPIVSVLMRSATIMTARDVEAAKAASDLYIAPPVQHIEIRDWRAFEAAVEAGHAATRGALDNLAPALAERLGLAAAVVEEEPATAQPQADCLPAG